jgi:hypothetical protein
MTIGVWILVGLVWTLKHRLKLSLTHRRSLLLACGLLAGLLPITHMHSFMVIVLVTGLICLTQAKLWRELSWFVLPAAVVSSLLFFRFVYGGIENPNFMIIRWGWTIGPHFWPWLIMWYRIWGIAIPVGLAGCWYLRSQPRTSQTRVNQSFFLSLWLVLILANVIIFQPTWWDNTKLFMWAYLGIAGTSALLLVRLWQQKLPAKLLALTIFLFLSLTGAIELGRLQQLEHNQVLLATYSDLALGEQIRATTQPDAVFLTDMVHNHPVTLWGVRPISMGYLAWVYNFGFNYHSREQAIKTIYQGGPQTDQLLSQLEIDYVVIGPGELQAQAANKPYFDQNYPVFLTNQNYTIYKVPRSR